MFHCVPATYGWNDNQESLQSKSEMVYSDKHKYMN